MASGTIEALASVVVLAGVALMMVAKPRTARG
jgi:hypothetical protein